MKKSSQVPATLVVAIASSLTVVSCGSSRYTENRCIDAYGNVVNSVDCNRGVRGAHWVPYTGTRSSGFGGFGGGFSGFGG